MKKTILLFACHFLLLSKPLFSAEKYEFQLENAWDTVKQDYQNFYQTERLLRTASFFAAGAVIAHTDIDTEFQSWYQDNIHSQQTDDLSKVAKLFGEKSILMPIATIASVGVFSEPESKFARWGQLSLRAYLLGGPIIGVTQPLTGGSRPRDDVGSKWRPTEDDNGVSGHAFVSTVPFLALTKMEGISDWQKNLAYAASVFGAWSRVNDDAHYLSQAVLGWYVAWEALNAIDETKTQSWFEITPYAFGDGAGLALSITW